jgi:MoaA/NifB/PqqE/SkfB family radical SAM enzyme
MNWTTTELRENATLRGLRALERGIHHVPEAWLGEPLRRWIATGIRHDDGVDFIARLALELRRRWPTLAPNVRRRFVENLFGRAMLLGGDKRQAMVDYMGEAPYLMVISPTMRCNLKCTGCYSANYQRADLIDTATFDRLLTEVKEMGIHFVVVSGGEPFIRGDLLRMFEKHHDILFMTYTNGTIIYRDKLAPALAELGNVVPCISVEGFAAETDARRGPGVFDRVIGAMGMLRQAGVLFGYSATPMRHNNELVVSDEFVDFYLNLGAFVGWYFNYMPVGRNPDLSLMPTVQQRRRRMERINEIRRQKHIVVSDFWCDGTLVGGCLSAGRVYFHVNAQGGIEPCVFHQFSVDNILNKSLKEALNSEYFRFIRRKNYEQDNPLTPCPVIDNPHILREAVRAFRPTMSQAGGLDTVERLARGLDRYSRELHATFDPMWAEMQRRGYGNGNGEMRLAAEQAPKPVARETLAVAPSAIESGCNGRATAKANGNGKAAKANGNGRTVARGSRVESAGTAISPP